MAIIVCFVKVCSESENSGAGSAQNAVTESDYQHIYDFLALEDLVVFLA